MTSRAQQKDTEADLELYRCLNSSPPQSFQMVAGAGSGKTTSLIKGLFETQKTRREAQAPPTEGRLHHLHGDRSRGDLG